MSASAQIGGFAAPEVNRILATACRRAGLDPAGAEVLRGHTNGVFRLGTAPVVVKVARRGTRPVGVRRTVQLVEWLTGHGFPTVPLHPVEQPVLVDEHAVTFWTYLPQPEHPVRAEQLAGPLARLHRLPEPPCRLRPLDTVGAIRRSLATISALATLSVPDLVYLTTRLARLEKRLTELRFALPPGILQGDPQHRNALHDGGRAVLCDWDTASYGPPEMDLVTIEIHCRRFGYGPAHYAAFAAAYGFDVTAWDGYPVLRDLRELRMITTNAKRAAPGSRTWAEVRGRIAGLRTEDHTQRWRIL
ncbi:aminoglycoside phosphotransferase family protein [Kitasatospora sp. LaBMicrA B282]|uniref:aminoglycoside phosphotransferase family protein n=1 Tax=Kitasatospora sp. LaBMicrA B282 TaxID=3420949 RepID=UPI003D134C4E